MSILRLAKKGDTRQPAKMPVPYVSQRGGASAGFGGGSSTGPLSRMSQVGMLFAVVTRLATATAAPDWELYQSPTKRLRPEDDDNRQIVEPQAHPAALLLDAPNPFMSWGDLVEIGQQHVELVGECFLVVTKAGQIPLELWPVRPDRMREVPDPSKYIAGWDYKTPDGAVIHLAPDEVIHIKTPNPENFYRGLSPVTALIRDLDGATAASEWCAAFFRNSAMPGGIIKTDRRLSDDEFAQLRNRWDEQHRGTGNAHRVAIMEAGEWVNRPAFSMRDLEFSSLRNLASDQIMMAYGISRATMGLTDGVNYAAALAARVQFAELLQVPRLERWKNALNRQLLPMFGSIGEKVEFDYCSPVDANPEQENAERDSKVAAVVALKTAGWNPQSAAEAYGLPEMDFGTGEDSDPDRDLMIELVKAAPAALGPMLLPVLLPDVEFPKPEPAAPSGPPPGAPGAPDDGSGDGSDEESAPPPDNRSDSMGTPGSQGDGAGTDDGGAQNRAAATSTAVPRETSHAVELALPPAGIPLRLAADEQPDLGELDAAWQKALAAVMARWPSITAEQGRQVRAQIVTLLEAGDVAGLAKLAIDTDEAAAVIEEGMGAIAHTAAALAVIEGVDAGAEALTAATVATLRLDVIAVAVAALLGNELETAGAREALRLYSPDESPAAIGGAVEAALRERGDTSAKAQIGGALTGASNAARVQTFASGPVGSLYATEQLDNNTCKFCKEIDGRFICTTEDLGLYNRLYTSLGGYANCAGGVRCRGSVTGAWRKGNGKPIGIDVGGDQST